MFLDEAWLLSALTRRTLLNKNRPADSRSMAEVAEWMFKGGGWL